MDMDSPENEAEGTDVLRTDGDEDQDTEDEIEDLIDAQLQRIEEDQWAVSPHSMRSRPYTSPTVKTVIKAEWLVYWVRFPSPGSWCSTYLPWQASSKHTLEGN